MSGMTLYPGADADTLSAAHLWWLHETLRTGLGFVIEAEWPVAPDVTAHGSLPEALSIEWYELGKARETVAGAFGPCLVYLWIGHGLLQVSVAGPSRRASLSAVDALREDLGTSEPRGRHVPVTFWYWAGAAAEAHRREIAVEPWDEVRSNYARRTRERLDELVRMDAPTSAGRLLLWHGPPGTGKTFAIRALAWEWRTWADVHYVTDPEVMFGTQSGYLADVLLDPDETKRWRVLVLEDTGELVGLDAKERAGQGLSRLLNLMDGLLGQGVPVLALVTTNEPVAAMHPAVTRPGRALAVVEFPELTSEEARTWLSDRGHEARRSEARTIAELFATVEGRSVAPRRPRVGFSRE